MPRRRWKWIEESWEWAAFKQWKDALGYADRVQVDGALRTILVRGPEYGLPDLGDDLHLVVTARGRTMFWLIVGIAQADTKDLLPLAWGTNADDKCIDMAREEAAEKLQRWRRGGDR